VESVATDGVSSDIDRLKHVLLDSDKPEHTEPSGQSAAKRTDDSYQGKGCLSQCSMAVLTLL